MSETLIGTAVDGSRRLDHTQSDQRSLNYSTDELESLLAIPRLGQSEEYLRNGAQDVQRKMENGKVMSI